MINYLKKIYWKSFIKIDGILKFPNLKEEEIGIQLGFDMSTPITSDLFTMHNRVTSKGLVVGIDPDPKNHQIASEIIIKKQLSITLIQKGTFSEKNDIELLLGEKSSWNQLANLPIDSTVTFNKEKIKVEINTLDSILDEQKIDLQNIGHINLTINGAEYDTLLGMNNIFKKCENLSLTIIAGRYDESGTINGKSDLKMILPILHDNGFKTKFKRINQSFWWGIVSNLISNRKWVSGEDNWGVIMAGKGSKKPKWFQSFS